MCNEIPKKTKCNKSTKLIKPPKNKKCKTKKVNDDELDMNRCLN